MTVTTTGVRETKAGDGVTIAWSFSTFVALDPSHVKVKLRNEVTGVITTLTYTTEYSVALTGTALPAAGSITLLGAYASSPPDTDTEIEIYRETLPTQETPLDPRSPFSSSNPEAIFDRYVLLAQEAFDRAARAMVLDAGDEPAALDALPNLIDRASKYLGFDADGQPVALDAPADTTSLSVYMATLMTSASEAALKAAINAEVGVDFAGIATANVFTADQTIRSTDGGASAGPGIILNRASSTPANNDALGAVNYNGRDSGGNTIQWANHFAEIVNVSAAAKASRITWQTHVANALSSRFHMGGGIFARDLTDPGDGLVNADGYQIGNVAGPHHYIQLEDQKADGTAGDAITIDAWTKATLNTEVADTGGHASLASSVIALAAGTYEFEAWMLSHQAGGSKRLRLRNTDDNANLNGGGPGLSVSQGVESTFVGQGLVRLSGRFTIAATKNVELQYFAEANAIALDDDRETAGVEVYAQIIFRKVA